MNTKSCITWVLTFSFLYLLATYTQVLARGYGHSSNVTVEVISDERGSLAKYGIGLGNKHAKKSYVVARNDERYSLRIRNRRNERIGVVIAVDGRNILSGRKSNLKPNERMYILGPYESAEYEGWRTGRNRVHRFYFTGMSDSYAAAWGDYSAMGVIAIAAYTSRYQDMFGHKGKKKNRPMNQPRSNARRQDPGTGFGEPAWSPSRAVHFSPQDKPVTKEFIKYEWRSTLCKRGVIDCRKKRMRSDENRFWQERRPKYGFAPYPPRWRYR